MKMKRPLPGDNTMLTIFRPFFWGGGQHKDGGVDRGYYGNSPVAPIDFGHLI